MDNRRAGAPAALGREKPTPKLATALPILWRYTRKCLPGNREKTILLYVLKGYRSTSNRCVAA
jgi:hypothetical protein